MSASVDAYKEEAAPGLAVGELANLPHALDCLKVRDRWVVWCWETKPDGKRAKVPYDSTRPTLRASTTRPMTWAAYESALDVYQAGEADGIGYVLTGDDVAALDLDRCRDPETGAIAPWAQEIIDRCNSCAEVTVSGAGLRVVGIASGGSSERFPVDRQ